MSENKIVYGAVCVWWDSIDKAGLLLPDNLPCCPNCGGVLYEIEESEWWSDVKKYQNEGHLDYKEFIEWQRGRCFKTYADARQSYLIWMDQK